MAGDLEGQLRLLIQQHGLEAVQIALDGISSTSSPPRVTVNDATGCASVRRQQTDVVLGSSFGAVLAMNQEGIIIEANAKALFILGLEGSITGRNITSLICGEVEDVTDEFWKGDNATVATGSGLDMKAKRGNGSCFPCRIFIQNVVVPALENEGKQSSSTNKVDNDDSWILVSIQDITLEKRARQLSREKRAAEQLLMNMLPREIAHRLQRDPAHIADHFSQASVLFADIVGFTRMSNSLTPIQVVEFLNSIFSKFDAKLDKYGLNKVKTIGDCYMVTSIPSSDDPSESCAAVCHFAMDMVHAIEEFNKDHPDAQLNMRIGINAGPVVAGIVGTKRFLYDIWGDAVNIASRMESTGLPGRVQVTKAVVDLVRDDSFVFEKRGMVSVKGIGEMETYFVKEHNQQRAIRYWQKIKSSFLHEEDQKTMDLFELLRLMKEANNSEDEGDGSER